MNIVVPDGREAERSSKILFPEHVTVRAHGQDQQKHLYIFRPGRGATFAAVEEGGKALEYARDLGEIQVVARATLVDDGIVFRYDFANRSAIDYDMILSGVKKRLAAREQLYLDVSCRKNPYC